MTQARWPHQERAVAEIIRSIDGGERKICVTAPTGSGKTLVMVDLLEWASARNWQAALFTNRRSLCAQTKEVLESHGIFPGMRASGYERALLRPIQLCMTQTEGSQVFSREIRGLHDAKLVLIDEAHLQTGRMMERIMAEYVNAGAHVVGFTATPLDLGDFYGRLIVAAEMSECLAGGVIVPAITYAPDEPDLRHIRKYQVGMDLSEPDNAKAMMRPGIFGRVWDHWMRLNPNRAATILFAPGVKESLWFAEQFCARGVRAGHIDGSDAWLDGKYIGDRQYIIDLVRRGEVPIICNRFVLREGIDIPELRCGILATVFGALSSYLQSCGRLLRSATGKIHATIIDHGGNWHRHGSVNADRHWELGLTNHRAVGQRQERLRDKKDAEPIVCPNCLHAYLPTKRGCPMCGHIARGKSRMVVQVNGQLKPRLGDIYRARPVQEKPDTAQRWLRYFHGARASQRSFNQARAWFFYNEGYWPPPTLPFMPLEEADWFRRVADVPRERLRQ